MFIYLFSFLSLKFQNIKFFITLFCKAYKVETLYTHGKIVDLLCTPTAASPTILVPLFFFFFLSLQLAKIKNLLPQNCFNIPLGCVKRIWYLSPMRAAKVQASLRIRAVSPEPSLLAHTSRESRGTFRQKARSLTPLNGWACAVKICHDGMLEDTNSLDGAPSDGYGSLLYF